MELVWHNTKKHQWQATGDDLTIIHDCLDGMRGLSPSLSPQFISPFPLSGFLILPCSSVVVLFLKYIPVLHTFPPSFLLSIQKTFRGTSKILYGWSDCIPKYG